MNYEKLRNAYRPMAIRVLFVGESPPTSGAFFYRPDSRLACYTRDAFSAAFHQEFADGRAFLSFFQKLGCYLDDLCLLPINHKIGGERKRLRDESMPELAGRMREASPGAIVVVMRAILRQVEFAARISGLSEVPMFSLPYPSRGSQRRYIVELAEILRELVKTNLLEDHPDSLPV